MNHAGVCMICRGLTCVPPRLQFNKIEKFGQRVAAATEKLGKFWKPFRVLSDSTKYAVLALKTPEVRGP
jgi:hypothetical protein